jgi:hypothetical protein
MQRHVSVVSTNNLNKGKKEEKKSNLLYTFIILLCYNETLKYILPCFKGARDYRRGFGLLDVLATCIHHSELFFTFH